MHVRICLGSLLELFPNSFGALSEQFRNLFGMLFELFLCLVSKMCWDLLGTCCKLFRTVSKLIVYLFGTSLPMRFLYVSYIFKYACSFESPLKSRTGRLATPGAGPYKPFKCVQRRCGDHLNACKKLTQWL